MVIWPVLENIEDNSMNQEFEYIIIGGGSAGMAVAARLSAAKKKTLLIEAGPVKRNLFNFWKTAMPAAYGYAFMNPSINWMYEGEPEPTLNNRKMYQPRGKLLGGSSSINGMGFVRPHYALFDEWIKHGAQGWSYDEVLPYFKKLETWTGVPNQYRGTDGPVHVKKGDFDCPYYGAFIEAGKQAGYSYTDDNNAETQEGFGHFQMNIEKGYRASTAHAYKKHVVDKTCLTILGNAQVSRLMIKNDTVTGVEYIKSGKKNVVTASNEVILSGGAFNTPQLMMLSGLGPEQELSSHGIKPVNIMSGVGQNLQDHPILYPKYLSKNNDSPIKYQRLDRKAVVGVQWLLNQKGPGASNYMEAIAIIKSEATVAFPDIEFQFCPLVIDHAEGGAKNNIHGWSNSCGPVAVEGRGWVKLRSKDPLDTPRILCNFMNTDYDIKMMHKAFEINREVMSQPAFKPFLKDELEPGFHIKSKADINNYILEHLAGDYHPVGTCKIGVANDPTAVVDSQLRVHGINNLRIADASVMPVIPNANTNATSIMIGERAADFILNNTK